MSAAEHQPVDDPVLVDSAEAISILGVSKATFDRLCRERRFTNWGGPGLFRSAELRRYRAQDKRLEASAKGVTNAAGEPSKSAHVSVTPPAQIGAGERNDLGLGNDTLRRCEGCGREFRPRRCTHLLCCVPQASVPPPECCSMSEPLDLSPAAVVARTLAKLRAAGLLSSAPAPEPAGPQRGPRRCPQRNRYKRQLRGPQARQPLQSGQHPPGLRSLSSRR